MKTPNSTNKTFFKIGVQIISEQFIPLDNGYIFYQIYEHMHVTEITIFTRVFHPAAKNRSILFLEPNFFYRERCLPR